MKTVRIEVDFHQSQSLPKGRVDYSRLDATTEADLAVQQVKDDADAMQDAPRHSDPAEGPNRL